MSRLATVVTLRGQRLHSLLVIIALVTALALIACDDVEELRVENHSGSTVVVFDEGREVTRIGPGLADDFTILPFNGSILYEVRSPEGALLERLAFTWDEINDANGFVIKISDEDFPP